MTNRSKRSNSKNQGKTFPAAKLPDDIAVQLSPMQAEILTRVMNDNANHRVNDLIESHGEMADAVVAGMMGSGIGEQFSAQQKIALYGLMKLCFLWGVRAEQEDWTARYSSDK